MVLVVLVIICLIGLLVATPFGLFLSGQLGVGDNIQTAVSHLAGEYNARVQEIQDDTPHDELDIAEDIPTAMMNNWRNVLSVYAVCVTTDELNATEVVTLTDEKLNILRETFWDMNQLDYHTTSRTVYSGEDDDEGTTIVTLHITATTKNAEEMAEEYGFDERQKGLLDELLSSEYDELFEALLGTNPALIPGDLDGVLIPGDVSEVRRQVIATGSQLLGRVHYFWGGKSLVLGWDSRWGTPKRVWAAGSPSTGTVRPFGLDCSGYVDWVFYNVSGGTYVIGHGGGASMQHSYCTTIPWSEAQPGDLAFYPGDSHVGIIVGYDEAGNVKIMHCASGSSNNVVLTGKIGFSVAARPRYYGGAS
ncbi:MAG: C40 family peptidase [Oscillibacter sp.]|nr:C40 family peptidase [Oscillibacter sp.]